MIARLSGVVVERTDHSVVIDVAGVGYEVHVGPALSAGLDGEVVLSVHTEVREDGILLFGFASASERNTFRILMGVNGVGPRLAQALVDGLGVQALTKAIETDDLRVLCSVPGVGKKIGQRLALELKGKMPVPFQPSTPTLVAELDLPPNDPLPLALARLGYKKSEIDRAVGALAAQGLLHASLQDRLSASLRVLSGGRV